MVFSYHTLLKLFLQPKMDIKDYYYTSYIFNYILPVGFVVYNICQTTSNVSWMNKVMPSKQATRFTRVGYNMHE